MTYDYLPYGGMRTETKNSSQAIDNTARFASEYLDPTGLYYLRAREYDPGSGRFLSMDPKPPRRVDPASSPYTYALGNPVRLTDPSGLDTRGLCIQVAAGFVLFGGEQLCIQISGAGEIGITATTSYGAGTPSVSLTAGVQTSSATRIENLGGPFGYAGGSGGVGIVGGGDAFFGQDVCGRDVTGGTFGAGVGAGPLLEGHGGQSQTATLTLVDFGGLFGYKDPVCKSAK